jgi:hypothetical protein
MARGAFVSDTAKSMSRKAGNPGMAGAVDAPAFEEDAGVPVAEP